MMNYFLAILPILIVLILMLIFRWGGQRAGPAGWLVGFAIAVLAFGLNWQVWWVSQIKGLLLSINVLAVLWAALLLYNLVDQLGGIRALAFGLEGAINDRGLLLVILAWAFSGLLEGLSGFGLPVAVVAPMLLALGVEPVLAVAATAIGHAWSVSFGDMGIIYQTLITVSGMDGAALIPTAALLLGLACAACGLIVALLLGQIRRWPVILLLAAYMSFVQYFLASRGFAALGAFGAAAAGIVGGVFVSRLFSRSSNLPTRNPQLVYALVAYGAVIILMIVTTMIAPLRSFLSRTTWQFNFPEVVTAAGLVTPAGPGQVFHPFIHPGVIILFSVLLSTLYFRQSQHCPPEFLHAALRATWASAMPSTIGVVTMVGLSTLMDHSGMTMLLARGLSAMLGSAFPMVSPFVGMLGAFATGSNNNSNVLFAPMQKQVAELLKLPPAILVSAQTVGGSLGSMIAPAKLVVGCSTTGLKGQDGRVLRYTLPAGLFLGLLIGMITWLLARG